MNWIELRKIIDQQSAICAYEDDLNEHDSDTDTCDHDIINVDGFHTCKLCGSVMGQMFKKESDDYGFVEDKKVMKTKYSQIGEIRKKFLIYAINAQKKISNKDYRMFAMCWNDKKFDCVNKKNVLSVIEQCNLDKNDSLKYFCNIMHDSNHSHTFDNALINYIFSMCVKFIAYFKGVIKNINKRCLIFMICREKQMLLYDYIGFMDGKIIQRYDEHYFAFQTARLISTLKHNNLIPSNT